MGYKRAGFDVVGNVEIDPRINEVYIKNLKPKYNYCMDLREFNKLENLPAELFGIDILDGSPPCTTFSTAGKREKTWGKPKKFREGQNVQTLDDLFFVWLDTVEKLQPKIAIANNQNYPKLKLDFHGKPITFGEVRTGKGIPVKGELI